MYCAHARKNFKIYIQYRIEFLINLRRRRKRKKKSNPIIVFDVVVIIGLFQCWKIHS